MELLRLPEEAARISPYEHARNLYAGPQEEVEALLEERDNLDRETTEEEKLLQRILRKYREDTLKSNYQCPLHAPTQGGGNIEGVALNN